jgi:CRISPR system Cascade subunit CasE
VARSIKRFFHYKQQVSFTMVVFEGVIEITDAESFRSTLVQGIGREKAFGCGLLTIAP